MNNILIFPSLKKFEDSKVGSKMLISLKEVQSTYSEKYPDHETTFIDLKELAMVVITQIIMVIQVL